MDMVFNLIKNINRIPLGLLGVIIAGGFGWACVEFDEYKIICNNKYIFGFTVFALTFLLILLMKHKQINDLLNEFREVKYMYIVISHFATLSILFFLILSAFSPAENNKYATLSMLIGFYVGGLFQVLGFSVNEGD